VNVRVDELDGVDEVAIIQRQPERRPDAEDANEVAGLDAPRR